MNQPWIVLGAGYAGSRLARHIAGRGGKVLATVRDPSTAVQLELCGIRAVVHEFEEGSDVRVPNLVGAVCVLSIPPSKSGNLAIESRALEWAFEAGARRFIYWSSTSVYGESKGAEIRESSPVLPTTRIGRRRLESEARVRTWAEERSVPLAILRLVGIYGPFRNLKQRIARGDYALVDGGNMWSNRIHVDDIVGATTFVANQKDMDGVWLVSDGSPFQVKDFVEWNVSALGLPMPPSVPLESLEERARAFWTGDRRVNPERLLRAGWTPTWPNFREGTLSSWSEEEG